MKELFWLANELESGNPMTGREAMLAGAYIRMAVHLEEKRRVALASQDFNDTIASLLRGGQLIAAIKLRRQVSGDDLRNAKQYVETMRDKMRANGEIS